MLHGWLCPNRFLCGVEVCSLLIHVGVGGNDQSPPGEHEMVASRPKQQCRHICRCSDTKMTTQPSYNSEGINKESRCSDMEKNIYDVAHDFLIRNRRLHSQAAWRSGRSNLTCCEHTPRLHSFESVCSCLVNTLSVARPCMLAWTVFGLLVEFVRRPAAGHQVCGWWL